MQLINPNTMDKEQNITEDEAALYDRQIRLWGLDAQRRLRAARVLLIGIKGLGAEVAKNIVLSGIKSLTLLDSSVVDKEDETAQFLVSRADIGKNRAESSLEKVKLLNPMVEVTADAECVDKKPDKFFTNFDVICATCCPTATLCHINKICALNNVKFFAGDVFGYYGFMFSDLGEHEFAEEVSKPKSSTEDKKTCNSVEPPPKKMKKEEHETVTVKKSITFSRLEDALQFDWTTEQGMKKLKKTPACYFIIQVLMKFLEKQERRPLIKSHDEDEILLKKLRESTLKKIHSDCKIVPDDFSRYCFAELSPVCAVVGGVLGQEIIKAVSQKDQPHNNFFFYNGVDGSGMVDKIGS
ncbi:SUMO-activating enzyme subunit 1-like [Gigantopelta aegis]|uniref:SUMO-activating enzyme subunit 1-like n=1 Tax=Gigantopelta aegis TaxID=1735272 RepID=UPI001B88C489|nr:SUMO-activating enzyme subunit 1-like [Gigantopelta aegis]